MIHAINMVTIQTLMFPYPRCILIANILLGHFESALNSGRMYLDRYCEIRHVSLSHMRLSVAPDSFRSMTTTDSFSSNIRSTIKMNLKQEDKSDNLSLTYLFSIPLEHFNLDLSLTFRRQADTDD